MAEEEVATKAPESDMAEPLVPGDTPAQEGATMGEHCVKDRPTPSGIQPTGEISKLGDIDVYISKPSDYPHAPSKLLLLLTGGTGLHSTNNQLQADKFAQEGFLVVMPDMFENDPAPNQGSTVEETNHSIIEQIKMRAVETVKSFQIDMWLARHTPEKVLPILHKVIEGAKEEFADAVANGDGIYGCGYCFGAKYIMILGGERSDPVAWGQKVPDSGSVSTKKGPFLKVGAVAHGTDIRPDDFEGLKVPVTLACVENDQLFPDDIREAGEKLLKERGLEHEFLTYAGVPHGFAVVGEYEDAKIKTAQSEAFEQMLGWLKTH